MTDRIYIQGLNFQAVLGVLDEERTRPQTVTVDLTLETDTRTAAASRQLEDTIDYAAMAEAVEAHAVEARHLLVESLAEDIAELILADPRVSGVHVKVGKPDALEQAETVGVAIYRSR